MSARSSKWSHFALLFVGACVMLAGVGGFFAAADQDYKYSFDYESEDPPPRGAGSVNTYDTLGPEKQRMVDRALDGEVVSAERAAAMPDPVIKRNGTYYVFEFYSTFDWANPSTFGPVLLGIGGLVVTVDAMRRDVNHRR